MKLSEIAAILHSPIVGADAEFASISTDTRTLKPGQLFIALSGPNFNANDFVAAAVAHGAVGAIVEAAINTVLPAFGVSVCMLLQNDGEQLEEVFS